MIEKISLGLVVALVVAAPFFAIEPSSASPGAKLLFLLSGFVGGAAFTLIALYITRAEGKAGRVIYFDKDMVMTGDLSKIIEYERRTKEGKG